MNLSTQLVIYCSLLYFCATPQWMYAQSNCTLDIPFDTNTNYSVNYDQLMELYHSFDACSPIARLDSIGLADNGYPIHMLIIDQDQKFSPHQAGKNYLLINNGIHAGEPCGIEASMLLIRELLQHDEHSKLLEHTVLLIIPAYSIGGMLNRNSTTRANQNGPIAYGFRGNARNLDLNRDFIKCDSRNAQTFVRMFSHWDPDVFIDTHTSNGADYPYNSSIILSQAQRLMPALRTLVYDDFWPSLQASMKAKDDPIIPYVMSIGKDPSEGIFAFDDKPRYSMGYAHLSHCMAMTTETHMLKSFEQRVHSTLAILKFTLHWMHDKHELLHQRRAEARQQYLDQQSCPIAWKLDTTQQSSITFQGYTAKERASTLTSGMHMYYDHAQPYTKQIKWLHTYKAVRRVNSVQAYLIPQAWTAVIERLKWNGIKLHTLPTDTIIRVTQTSVLDYTTVAQPYEGHYLHSQMQVAQRTQARRFREGDVVIAVDATNAYFLNAVLQADAEDSYFAWGFFDSVLQQKEHFSPYVFESTAEQLMQNPDLKAAFDQRMRMDPDFAQSRRAQLDFIYKHSAHHESDVAVVPVFYIERSN